MRTAANDCYCDRPERIPETVQQFVTAHRLLQGITRLGIAVSGGPDSVALLHLLAPICARRKIAVTILHLDHGLRMTASEEADFVRRLATTMALPFRMCRMELGRRLPDGLSIEMAGREARQTFFAECCRAEQLDAIATGHQADDIVETLILRLSRGAGLTGLSALRPRSHAPLSFQHRAGRPVVFIRPLLNLSAAAIRQWIADQKIDVRTDESNRDPAIPRNLVRHTVLPYLGKHLGSALAANFCRTADILRMEDDLLGALADKAKKRICKGTTVNIRPLLRLHPALQRRVLRQWLFDQNIPSASGYDRINQLIRLIATAPVGRLQLTSEASVIIRDHVLERIQHEPATRDPLFLPVPGSGRWGDFLLTLEPAQGFDPVQAGIGIFPTHCSINPEVLHDHVLQIRSRLPGDRIDAIGLKGTKKLQDLFVDEKFPEHLRDELPILACGKEIVWVPGYRIAKRFAVPSASAPALKITLARIPSSP